MDSCVEKKEVYQDISSYYLGVISGITDNFMKWIPFLLVFCYEECDLSFWIL